MPHERFSFGIADAARFLGKSPVTLRKWEATGFWTFPRDDGSERKLGLQDLAEVAEHARAAGRITAMRLVLINQALGALEDIEMVNS